NMLYGWDWPDISQEPTLAWATFISKGIGAAGSHVYADGKIFTGNHEGTAMCLDGKTGNMLWETPVEGYIAYYGSYYDDRWVASCGEGIIYCFNATTGEILWEFNPGIFYSFWGETGAIYDGVIYPVSNNYHTYAIDIYTGELLWDFKSTQGAGYQTHTIAAGGCVYAMTGRAGYLDPDTGMPFKDEYVCLDAKTGEVLWKTDRVIGGSGGGPPAVRNIIAYGNLYLAVDQEPIPGSYQSKVNLVCIGPPQPWPSFQNDAANTGNGQRGAPEQLSLKWTFDGDAAFTTDPVASDGKIYIGSLNGTFYCLDHLTGDPIWTFETLPTANRIIDWDMSLQTPEGFTTDVTAAGLISTIKSTAALDGAGRVFFVSDGDGYIYCLDATNGNQNWKTFIGANATLVYQTQVRYASSPKVVDGKVYVGSKNGIFYCLNTANGNIVWTFDTQNRQLSSTPAISDGAVYVTVGGTNNRTYSESTITTGDNGTLYKFDANTGNLIWETGVPFYIARSMRQFQGSPVVGDGIVFQSSNNWATYAFNASTGAQMWCFAADFGGSLPNTVTPAYANGRVYVHEYFSLACVNATTGEKIWSTWLAREQLGGPIYADGKIYVSSELKAFWVLDALTGEKYDFYTWDDFCWSNPCVYAGNLYWGTAGKKVFCFEQAPYGETTYGGAEPEPPEPEPPTLEELLSPLQSSVDELEGSVSATEGSLNTLDSSVGNLESNMSNLTTYLLVVLVLVIIAIITTVYLVLKIRK
ncbi:MAG: PQQ-binding-like beta-propeller repeat protein, partial [Candidatus Bathyarchaeota archaeon]|nr:PQQ-binding-like beta-propeller repeat protein [Candidatus Bathyarchaeota archaeon]